MLMNILNAILVLVGMSGCAASGGGSAKAAAQVPVTQPGTVVTAPQAPINLTYYKLTAVDNPQWNGHPGSGPITTNGYCVQYLSNTYCWDDGAQGYANEVSNGISEGPFYDSYWNFAMQVIGGNLVEGGTCRGNCLQDTFTQPRTMGAHWYGYTDTSLAKVNAVLTTGASKAVTCTLSGVTLNCVDFSIDLSQIAL